VPGVSVRDHEIEREQSRFGTLKYMLGAMGMPYERDDFSMVVKRRAGPPNPWK